MPVYALGDSITKGVYLNEEGRYVVNHEAMMESLFKKLGLDFINGSAFGATVEKGYELFLRKEKFYVEDSFIFVLFGGNDCNHHWDEVALSPDKPHRPLLTLETFAEKYQFLLGKLIERGLKPVPITLPPLDDQAFFNYLAQHLSGTDLLKFLGETINIYKWQESYDQKVREIARLLSLPLLDLREALLSEENYREYICPDGMHLNPRGQSRMSEKLLEPIQRILRR